MLSAEVCARRERVAALLRAGREATLPADLLRHASECPHCRPILLAAGTGPSQPAATRLLDESQSLVETPTPRPAPSRFGRYVVEGVLGRGGMGCVYKATDPLLKRPVAVKVMSSRFAADPVARQAFLREARAAAAVQHDNVVPIYTAGEQGGTAFLVMQYVGGGTLEDRLLSARPLPRGAVLAVGRQVAAGLAAAHASDLIHRDVKPANILLDPAGPDAGADQWRARVADFGLSHAANLDSTARRPRGGTPEYMAPEQIRHDAVDHRTDLYALGVVLYRMATGRPPFVAESVPALQQMHLTSEPPRPSLVAPDAVPPGLEELILQLLEKEPAARPASAAAVTAALDRIAGESLLSPAERARLAALRRLGVLDTGPDAALDDLVSLASHVCGTPIALVSLVDEDRQWFKAGIGIPVAQTPRNTSFCNHTVREVDLMEVPDATKDERFRSNPAVTGAPFVRFYAGVPLTLDGGHAAGSLCVVDQKPRELTDAQREALRAIARLVVTHLKLHRDLAGRGER